MSATTPATVSVGPDGDSNDGTKFTPGSTKSASPSAASA